MSILKSVSFSTLQTFNHLLTEMEREGVYNLAEARLKVSRETEDRYRMRRSIHTEKPKFTKTLCPHCGEQMTVSAVDGEVIAACRNCRYSFLVEM